MSVELIDKRRPGQRICGLGLPNGTWFKVLDIPGMEKLVDTSMPMIRWTSRPAERRKWQH